MLVLVIAAGIVWWSIARHYEDTDDAFIDAHIIHVAPQIAGEVTSVAVDDNATVAAGQSLVEINPQDSEAHLNQMQAQELQAEKQYQQAIANAAAADAQAENARRDVARYHQLQQTTPGAVAQEQLDQSDAASRTASAQRDAAHQQIAGAAALVKADKAQVAAAQLTLGYTHIVAPEAGHVVQRSVAVGDYVVAGQQLLDIVPTQIWVTANFKETQLEYMRPGQPVTVSIDSCGIKVPGHIDSLQRGAGQAFGLLPPENATGNYVKVVQRVPVKIVLDHIPDNCPVGPGMSVEPRVKVK